MRSRYSAHVLGLVDYVVQTYHPECQAHTQRQQIADSVHLNWCHLQVISSGLDPDNNEQGYVEFRAQYIEEDKLYSMQELSRFLRLDNLWFYVDGSFDEQRQTPTLKIKRNDPCPCGSEKKFKKCCG
jgi:SEC-C motif-containing protein